MSIRAVLFDVGGPIDTEEAAERLIDARIREALAAEGIAVTDEAYAQASRAVVESFAPDAYRALLWYFSRHGPEIAARVAAVDLSSGRPFELRPGIADLLARLHGRGLLLGLAANQPARVLADLERHGLARFFAYREVTAHHGYRKPDVRLFLRACETLGVQPDECVMVGDRVDNDIVPARLLGMRTVLFRTGRHREQRPRSLAEVADVEVETVEALGEAIDALTARQADAHLGFMADSVLMTVTLNEPTCR